MEALLNDTNDFWYKSTDIFDTAQSFIIFNSAISEDDKDISQKYHSHH